MKRIFLFCIGMALVFAACDRGEPGEDVLLVESSSSHPAGASRQLGSSARIPEAEIRFLSSLKQAIQAKDKKAIEALYELKGVNPAVADVVPSVIAQLSELPLEGAKVVIEPNDKAARFGVIYTVPYLGEVVIRYKDKTSSGSMRVPVGIRDGRYYLTIAASPGS